MSRRSLIVLTSAIALVLLAQHVQPARGLFYRLAARIHDREAELLKQVKEAEERSYAGSSRDLVAAT